MHVAYSTREAAKDQLAQMSFRAYIDRVGVGMRWQWFHHAIADYVDAALIHGHFPNIMFKAPARHGKTEILSRRLPTYYSGLFPENKILNYTHNDTIARNNVRDLKNYYLTGLPTRIFPEIKDLDFHSHGYRHPNGKGRADFATLMTGTGGMGGHLILLDDYHGKRSDAMSTLNRNKVIREYESVVKLRSEEDAIKFILSTQWHKKDLMGHLEELMERGGENSEIWEVVTLQAEKTPMITIPDDPRKDGELLWEKTPEKPGGKFTPGFYLEVKENDPETWHTVFQGDPDGAEVSERKDWFPLKPLFQILSLQNEAAKRPAVFFLGDTASSDKGDLKAGEKRASTVFFACVELFGRVYVLDVFREQLKFHNIIPELDSWLENWYESEGEIIIEAKSNGKEIGEELIRKGYNVRYYNPPKSYSKEDRFDAATRTFAAKRVIFADHCKDTVKRVIRFPKGDKDEADVASMIHHCRLSDKGKSKSFGSYAVNTQSADVW